MERAYTKVTLSFFPPASQPYWTPDQVLALKRIMSAMRKIDDFGPFHVSSFEEPGEREREWERGRARDITCPLTVSSDGSRAAECRDSANS